jgi:hypothetical protein
MRYTFFLINHALFGILHSKCRLYNKKDKNFLASCAPTVSCVDGNDCISKEILYVDQAIK